MYYTPYHLATSAAEEIGQMSKRQRRCYFCHQGGASEASSSDICFRHQTLISLRLFVLLARSGRFGKFWRVVKWER
jgi:hypothetical protein